MELDECYKQLENYIRKLFSYWYLCKPEEVVSIYFMYDEMKIVLSSKLYDFFINDENVMKKVFECYTDVYVYDNDSKRTIESHECGLEIIKGGY